MNTGIDTNLFIDKVGSILPDLEAQGSVYLFAFAEHDDVDRWDIVLSSDWSDKDSEKAVQLVYNKLRPRIDLQELILISRIAVIPSSDPKVRALTNRLVHITPQDHLIVPSKLMLPDDELLGSAVRRAFVFKAQRSLEAVTDEVLNDAATHS